MPNNDLCQHPETYDNAGATPVQRDNGKPPRGGAPRGNLHNFRFGHRSARRAVPLNRLGKEYAAIDVALRHFRRALEQAVVEARGEVSLIDGMLISTAIRHEAVAETVYATIRRGKAPDVPQALRLASDSSIRRDAAIRKLELTAGQPDGWSEVDAILAAEREADQSHHDDAGEDFDGDDMDDGSDSESLSDEASEDDAADPEVARQWEEVDEAIRQGR